jgi:pimeloyl-ACP methyl ester carboxylesterase
MDATEVAALLGQPACEIKCRHFEASSGFHLRVYSFYPKGGGTGSPVVFIPGWTSVMEGWAPLLSKWVEQREIHYIETREKRSAIAPKGRLKKEHMAMIRHAEDLSVVMKALDLGEDVLWFGSSLGATVILHGMMDGLLHGRAAFLISPNSEFRFATWMVPITWLPWWFYAPIIRIFMPYLKWRVKEKKQFLRYRRTLLSAHLLRLKRSLQANRQYDLPDGLGKIDIPVAICVAESDTLHTGDDAHDTAAALPKGELLEIPSNQYAHEADVIADINAWEVGLTDPA